MNGITRKVDELGRIVLPKEFRNALNVGTCCDMNMEIKDGSIILTPAQHICALCGKVIATKKIKLCDDCIALVKEDQ